jgi:hypothetical protein
MKENSLTLAQRGGAMRLTLSASVASDLGALKASLKSLAERLGHPNCATGCDILHLQLERDFSVRQLGREVELNPQPLPPRWLVAGVSLPQDPVPNHTVNVTMPSEAFNDIKQLTTAVERVVGKLGCAPCCSGFDILFRRELDLIVLDKKLDARGFGRFA